MLRLDRKSGTLGRVETSTLAASGLKEREDLQRLIAQSSAAVFAELGEDLLLLGDEVPAWEAGGERIDLLALDSSGTLVVIELKRGSDPRQLLQGIAYASVVAKWPADGPVNVLARFRQIASAEARQQIEDHLQGGWATLNTAQRVLLVAESFDAIVLATAEWLVERHNVALSCHRIMLHRDGANEFLSLSRVYPPEEALLPAISAPPTAQYTTWDGVLASMGPDARAFFEENLQPTATRKSFIGSKTIAWRLGGRRRLDVRATAGGGYVWQVGRFPGDEAFWRKRLSDPDTVKPQTEGRNLRFYAHTAADYSALKQAAEEDLLGVLFSDGPGDSSGPAVAAPPDDLPSNDSTFP